MLYERETYNTRLVTGSTKLRLRVSRKTNCGAPEIDIGTCVLLNTMWIKILTSIISR